MSITNVLYSESGTVQGPSSSVEEQLSLQQITKLAAALAASVGIPAVTIVPLDTPNHSIASSITTTTETQTDTIMSFDSIVRTVTVAPFDLTSDNIASTTTITEARTSLPTTALGITFANTTVTTMPERTSTGLLSVETSIPSDTTAKTVTTDEIPRTLHITFVGPNITSITNLKPPVTTATLVGNSKSFVTNLNLSTRSAFSTDVWEHVSTTVVPLATRSNNSPQSTASLSTTAIHFVDVGAQSQSLFNPIQIDAAVGDIVVFRFLRFNHTVTQSTFDSPCEPMGGFDSGFQYYNPLNQTGVINQVLPFLVRDSEPTWFYCRQSIPQLHCSAGMVFGINTGDNMNAFVAKAKASSLSTRDTRTGTYGSQYWNTTRESGSYSTGSSIPGPTTTTLTPASTGGAASKRVEGRYILCVASLFVALLLVPKL